MIPYLTVIICGDGQSYIRNPCGCCAVECEISPGAGDAALLRCQQSCSRGFAARTNQDHGTGRSGPASSFTGISFRRISNCKNYFHQMRTQSCAVSIFFGHMDKNLPRPRGSPATRARPAITLNGSEKIGKKRFSPGKTLTA